MVVVEYCCHGNLQQFLLARRHRFLNQVNPLTGIYDPNIKPSVIAGRRIGRSVSTVGGNRPANEAYSNKLVNSHIRICLRNCNFDSLAFDFPVS